MRSGLSDILSCPRCRGKMSPGGRGFQCGCGFELDDCGGFYGLHDSKVDKGDYTDYYTEGYFGSSLYDYSGYRLSRLVGLACPKAGQRGARPRVRAGRAGRQVCRAGGRGFWYRHIQGRPEDELFQG